MGLPANVKLSLTTSNYLTHGEPRKVFSEDYGEYYKKNADLENLVSGRVAVNMPVLEGATLSLDVGASTTIKFDEELKDNERIKTKPYTELKYKQNLAKAGNYTFRGYIRQRIAGDDVQERFSVGVSRKLNDKFSIYADGHYTMKFSDDKFDHKAGGWIGLDFNPTKNLNIWVEPVQVNRNLNKEYFNNPNDSGWRVSSNLGITFKF